jgi:RNA polymerase sigma-70 factor (ECF subfamily)
MVDNDIYIGLVRQAQLGDERSLNRLAELARERLRMYVYRITLSDHLTQDILQESMLEMFKFIDKLEKAERFWPWLRTIAANKINRHYRQAQNKDGASTPEAPPGKLQEKGQEAVAYLITEELKQTVFAAMNQLRPKHRRVLVLRCYEDMKYSEIAEEMGCTEFGARKLFFRAKKMLARQLARRGFGRGSLLVALALFGKTTATSEAAAANICLTASTVNAGLTASLAAMATTKTAVVSLAAVGLITAGAVVIGPATDKTSLPPHQSRAQSLVDADRPIKTSKRNSECWYYYPPKANGVVMMRLISGAGSEPSYCQWLQSDQANYYKRNGTIYMENYRVWSPDLSVKRLPTDDPQLREFLSQVEGKTDEMQYVPSDSTGLLVALKYDESGACSQITRRYDISDEEFFRYKWPAGADVVDNRDPMHKRGWTYFRITGQINNKEVQGRGRMPFVFAASKTHWPWLMLKVGDDVVTEAGFAGFPRPWMGLHTIDTVRRDAAANQILFETVRAQRNETIQVVLRCGQIKTVYEIDMKADLVERITFSTNGRSIGELELSYLQDIDQTDKEFVAPIPRTPVERRQSREGILWLVQLAEGN